MPLMQLWAAYKDGGSDDPEVVRDLVAALTALGAEIPPDLAARAAALSAASGIVVRSVRKASPAAGGLEAALRAALAARPSDTYLLARLLETLVDNGHIAADSGAAVVRARLPPEAQVDEATLAALLLLAARRDGPGSG